MPLTKGLHRTAVPNRGFPDPWGSGKSFGGPKCDFRGWEVGCSWKYFFRKNRNLCKLASAITERTASSL